MHVRAKTRPLLLAENYFSDLTACKLLLITHVLAGGRQCVESGLFRCDRQIAIPELVPALLCCRANGVAFETGESERALPDRR
jgi:hypothetical protein